MITFPHSDLFDKEHMKDAAVLSQGYVRGWQNMTHWERLNVSLSRRSARRGAQRPRQLTPVSSPLLLFSSPCFLLFSSPYLLPFVHLLKQTVLRSRLPRRRRPSPLHPRLASHTNLGPLLQAMNHASHLYASTAHSLAHSSSSVYDPVARREGQRWQ